MANEIACSVRALGDDIRQIETAYDSVVNNAEAVMTSVNELNGMWKGTAHDVFVSAVAKDYESIKELCNTVSEIISCLNFAKGEYTKCEQEVNNEIASIRI